MKKIILLILLLIIAYGLSFYWQNLRGIKPALGPIPQVSQTPREAQNSTGLPLKVPDGYSISIFAKNIPDARVLAWDPDGHLLVSSPQIGKVFRIANDGSTLVVATGLNKPHGLAFKDGKLYIAETDAVSVFDYDGTAKNKKKIVNLPSGGNHFSRTIGFGPDGKLYISIGSSCNVCVEKDSRRASIQVFDGDLKPFATGLRNSVFFTWRNGEMWATEMGRDFLGDDLPPDEINIIKNGKFYGWPYCWGKQITDRSFGNREDFCKTTEPSTIDLPAHSAPLGLAFHDDNLFVAYHGSWNRSVPTGYKIVKIHNGEISDFITGWLQGNDALGRPVDLLFDSKGNLYVSDDKAGVIYKVSRR